MKQSFWCWAFHRKPQRIGKYIYECPTCGKTWTIPEPHFPYSAGERRLMEMIAALDLKTSTQLEKTMALIDDLQAAVAAETTVDASAVALLNNLSSMLAAAGTDPAKLQAIKDTIDQNRSALAAAVTANTPAAAAPVPAASAAGSQGGDQSQQGQAGA